MEKLKQEMITTAFEIINSVYKKSLFFATFCKADVLNKNNKYQ